jgi:cytochrome c553
LFASPTRLDTYMNQCMRNIKERDIINLAGNYVNPQSPKHR